MPILYYLDMAADDLEILFASRIPGRMGRASHRYGDFWALHVVFGAEVAVSFDQERLRLEGDWCWPGHPGPLIAFAPSGRMPRQHYRCALRGAALAAWMKDGLWPKRPLPVRDAARMQACCEGLLESLHGDEPLDRRRRRHAVEGLLIELQRQQRTEPAAETWIIELGRHLEDHCLERPDYAALARRWHMPLHHLRRAFRAATGLPLHAYLLRARCRRAQQLILDDDAPLAAIAERCGYADPGFFARQFRRIAGVTPGSLRRSRYG